MNYDSVVARISELAPRGWRLGLDRMQRLVEVAGLSGAVAGQKPKYIQVAGTNGKGSTTAFLQSIFLGQGHRTGGFFSPFVYDLRERVQLGGELISKDVFAKLGERLLLVAEQMEGTEFEGVTEFEIKTALGFAAFQEFGCDWVALEVGLGGRLDATSVVTPAAGIITSIGWDHMAILGDTLEKIAFEKAGIIKTAIPTFVGMMDPGPLEVISQVACEHSSPLYRLGYEITDSKKDGQRVLSWEGAEILDDGQTARYGSKAFENFALATFASIAAGAVHDENVLSNSLDRVSLPGRFEHRTYGAKTIILDGAHNEDATRVLAKSLTRAYPGQKFLFLFSMVQGHDPAKTLTHLVPLARSFDICPIDFHRAQPIEEIDQAISELTSVPVRRHLSAPSAMENILSDPNEEIIVITGSFYLIGECGRAFNQMVSSQQVTPS